MRIPREKYRTAWREAWWQFWRPLKPSKDRAKRLIKYICRINPIRWK